MLGYSGLFFSWENLLGKTFSALRCSEADVRRVLIFMADIILTLQSLPSTILC